MMVDEAREVRREAVNWVKRVGLDEKKQEECSKLGVAVGLPPKLVCRGVFFPNIRYLLRRPSFPS